MEDEERIVLENKRGLLFEMILEIRLKSKKLGTICKIQTMKLLDVFSVTVNERESEEIEFWQKFVFPAKYYNLPMIFYILNFSLLTDAQKYTFPRNLQHLPFFFAS